LQESATVVGRVLKHVKGDKVDVFQYRQKTGYRRHTGHRQPLTLVEISELRLGEIVERADEKRAAEEAQRSAIELQKTAVAEAEAEAPKKVTPKRKAPAAKKPAAAKAAEGTATKSASAKKKTPSSDA